jgi:hypothetical protein
MPVEREPLTPEQVAKQISALRDSVWVITTTIAKPTLTESDRKTIERNVSHLELMMGKAHITAAGADLSDVTAAIAAGKAVPAAA